MSLPLAHKLSQRLFTTILFGSKHRASFGQHAFYKSNSKALAKHKAHALCMNIL